MILRSALSIAGLVLLMTNGGDTGRTVAGPPLAQANAIVAEEEELEYEVSWTFISLGTIRLHGKPDRTADAWMDSHENLPYVDLHSVYHSEMDSLLFSRGSQSVDQQEDGSWKGMMYVYDLSNHRVVVEHTKHRAANAPPHALVKRDTLVLPHVRFVDGLSIAYSARALAHSKKSATMPTVLMGKLGETTFHLPGERTTVDLDAVAYPVRAIAMEGTTSVVGIFGMSGEFTGWFSDDAAAVPLRGKLNVLIGSVTVELTRWNRRNWTPPQ
jgi:hypothetical protein